MSDCWILSCYKYMVIFQRQIKASWLLVSLQINVLLPMSWHCIKMEFFTENYLHNRANLLTFCSTHFLSPTVCWLHQWPNFGSKIISLSWTQDSLMINSWKANVFSSGNKFLTANPPIFHWNLAEKMTLGLVIRTDIDPSLEGLKELGTQTDDN